MVTAGGAWWSDAGGYVPGVLEALAEHPGKVVLRYPGTELTAGAYLRAVTGTYRTLRAAGAGRGTVVAVLTAPNSPDMITVRHAAHLAGAAVCFLRSTNPGTSTAMLPLTDQLGILRATGASVLYADRTSAARAAELAEGCGAFLIGPGQDGAARTEPTDDPGHVAPEHGAPDDLAVIMFTSGSTGRPKGIRKSVRAWEGTVRIAVETPPEAAEITALFSTPLSHSAGLLVDGALAVGGSVVLLPEFDADQVVRAVVEHGVTRTFMATTQLYRLLDHLDDLGHRDAAAAGLGGLRVLSYSGTSAAPSRISAALKVFGPVLLQLYGTTESGRITFLDPAGHADPGLAATVGRVFPEVEVEVRDPDSGAPLSDGQVGEIRMRSPQLMDGYLDASLDADALRDGWYRTGDIGYRDARGCLHLLDRVSDVVKVDGVKVYPAVVERELLTLPGVALAAVYGVRDTDGVEHLHAALTCRPGTLVEPDAVRKHISASLSPAQAPERVLVLDELPMNLGGKPDKARLREHSAATA
ncbi:class I adenylate-forming enzyme family protein [Streptomyces sp. NBC_00083]|uniref:class I adenylate-forming enzyme family protein n=1 Tax=Streptomyces sp. NBC_00083 TaxID=2975647 RepID=UPI002257508C|nr:AMP-binding protein [Streptomyces sp. NBC_00083]MCX5388048.1 AMP-binding protein [Streptomyces sp. NBC_00083]